MHRARFTAAAPGFLSNRALRFLPHRMHVVNKTLLSCAIGATLLACPLFAQADDDRFTLRLGAMQAEAESRFSADAEFGGQAYAFESGRYTLGDRTVPRAEGIFRIGNRHRLLFNYFRYAQDRDYAGAESPTASIGLQLGAQRAKLAAEVAVDSDDGRFTARQSETGTAPVVGVRLGFNTADQRWRFVAQGQYLDADWGDFGDYDGDLTRANALVEYRFTQNFGIHAGYDWFKLNVRRHGGDATVGLDQRFHGPMAGVTLAF